MNYNKHSEVIQALKDDQHAESDTRRTMDEVIRFSKGDQWEDFVKNIYQDRPRYTFDQTRPIVSDIWAEMAANDYAAKIDPVGDGASEEVANLKNGILRAIYSQSNFDDISKKVGKRGILAGFSAVKLKASFLDKSFYQDISIDHIPDAQRRVWFEAGSELQTREDANHVHVLSANISQEEAKARWGKRRTYVSVDAGRQHEEEYKPKDRITIGEIFYKEFYKEAIYLLNDEEATVTDAKGLVEMGIPPDSEMVLSSREADCFRVYSRKYDGKDWLDKKPKLSAFTLLPVVPMYCYFDVDDGKVTFEGAITRVMDACKIFNYGESRAVEETVLSMRQKLFVDDRVTGQYTGEFADLNRDPRVAQQFDGAGADKIKHGFGPMQMMGGVNVNPGITEMSNNMLRNVQLSTGRQNAIERHAMTSADSDFRADLRESIGSAGTFEYYQGYKIFLEHTMKVALSGFRAVYDTARKLTSIDESGQASEVEVNAPDGMGGIMNNLTSGKYTSTVSISDNMESRKAQANDGMLELAKYIPDVIERNKDIMASNISAPGMDMVADRERADSFRKGYITEDQLTEDEKEQLQAQASQPQQPDPAQTIAETEAFRVKSDALIKQAQLELDQAKTNGDLQVKGLQLELQKSKQDYENLLKAVQAEKLSVETSKPIDENVVNTAEGEI